MLHDWRCAGCHQTTTSESDCPIDAIPSSSDNGRPAGSPNHRVDMNGVTALGLSPIGVVNSWFPEKRGTPRQPGVSGSSRGKLTLFNSVFTNPEHALEGLEEFSHMW